MNPMVHPVRMNKTGRALAVFAAGVLIVALMLAGGGSASSAVQTLQEKAAPAMLHTVQPIQMLLLDKQEETSVQEKIDYYMEKLKDRSFTTTYGEGFTWYTAAEELGMIGKPAIPALIANLDTDDDYERALTLYALLLSTQEPNVKAFASDYIHANLYFDPSTHPQMVKEAYAWWNKYKSNWEEEQ